jgi:uncharacterized protein YuzE
MIVRIDNIEFDRVTYDREADVLYLWVGTPRKPAFDDASPEGHYLQFGPDGSLIAVTIVNARWLLEQDGKIVITLPDGRLLETADLGDVLAAA